MKINLAVLSADGKVGRRVVELAQQDDRIANVLPLSKSSEEGASILKRADVLIDFSRPHLTLQSLAYPTSKKLPIVIGTTGFSADEWEAIVEASTTRPILHASNFSLGIALIQAFLEKEKKRLGHYHTVIDECHSPHKKDTPSGTALELQKLFDTPPKIASARIEGAIATHRLTLKGAHESLTITHEANDRDLFAEGAIECALWLFNKPPGRYTVQDYLEDRDV